MVDENDENYENQEEGEYHFSEDQANYEIEPEETKLAEPEKPVEKKNFFGKLTPMRRMIIGVVSFVVVIYIVFKMLTPTPTAPSIEFTQTNEKAPTLPKIANNQTTTPPQTAPQQGTPIPVQVTPTSSAPPPQQPAAPVQTQMSAAPIQPFPPTQMGQVPPQTPPAPTGTPPGMGPPNQGQQTVIATTSQIAPPPSSTPQPPSTITSVAPPGPDFGPQNKQIMDRLAALEEQNNKLMTLLQTQIAQKIGEYEIQSNAVQEKVRVLNARLANIEANLNKVAMVERPPRREMIMPPPPSNLPPIRPSEPKLVYTVQAIIPGRAWLKSDLGDTVTVAEGDVLKDYGRITKIDPYDGIVDIDTGSKIISLSYGSTP